MSEEGYAPKTVAKPFRLSKQTLKYAVGAGLITKNPLRLLQTAEARRREKMLREAS